MSAWNRAEDAKDIPWWLKGIVVGAWVTFAVMALTLAALLYDDWRNAIN